MVHIALYGTLRRGQPMLAHFAGAALASGAMRWLGECRIPGRLLDCGAYPALVDCEVDGGAGVTADLFVISDKAVLAALDVYEECDSASPGTSEYRRESLTLLGGPVGGVGHAHAYVWNRAPDGLPGIESGDWLLHIADTPREPPRERPGGAARDTARGAA